MFKANVDVHDPIGESFHIALQAEVQEKDVFDLMIALMLVEMVSGEDRSRMRDPLHLPQSVMITKVSQNFIDDVVAFAAQVPTSLLDQKMQIVGRVELL